MRCRTAIMTGPTFAGNLRFLDPSEIQIEQLPSDGIILQFTFDVSLVRYPLFHTLRNIGPRLGTVSLS